MQSGYFQPLNNRFKLLWIWWVIFLSFTMVLYFENNMAFPWWIIVLMTLVLVYLYFLIRQRRFFASKHHLYFTQDFHLRMMALDLAYITAVRISRYRVEFTYAGKYYHYVVWGHSHKLFLNLLEENQVNYTRKGKNVEAKKA